ncbi:MAG: FkbM family methyltransferase [Azospirillaceae bacterium]|nr:FkbM family methyltransferase [Azospirillaceae bacterium]
MIDEPFSVLEQELIRFVGQRPPERISESLACGCYIYGAGHYGRRIAALLTAKGFPCLAFLDQRADETLSEQDGLPVIHPARLLATQAQGHCFVLGLHNPHVDVAAVLAYAHRLPFQHRVWNTDLPDALGEGADNFWMTKRQFLLDNFDRVRRVGLRFASAASVETLCALIRFRITGDYAIHPANDFATQYLPPDLPGFDRPITLVDGGAYTGDTLKSLSGLGVTIGHWIAFEPDQANFNHLAAHARQARVRADLYPCGLSDHSHQVHFRAEQGAGSSIVEDVEQATTTINCVALDDAIHGVAPDYIKLDIEGAESAALEGMRRVIADARPRMAVSAYHRPGDLWLIAERLSTLLPDASLHLCQHGNSAFDTVVYAIPPA